MKIRTCPSCGSIDIHLHLGGTTGMKYKCKTCGYIGPLIIERDVDKKFLKTKLMKTRKIKK